MDKVQQHCFQIATSDYKTMYKRKKIHMLPYICTHIYNLHVYDLN